MSKERISKSIEISNYSFRYNEGDSIIENLELEINKGESVAIVGDSGTGKTTLYSSITGLNNHFFRHGEETGTIKIEGNNVKNGNLQHVKHLGMVTQDFQDQLLAGTVESAIAYPLENMQICRDEMRHRVEEIMKEMGLEEIRNLRANELSGGQGQAVVLASMIAKDSDILILDDISSDLDPRGQERVKNLVAKLKQDGKTILITDSSDPKWLIEEFADRVVVLENGKIVNNPDLSQFYNGFLEKSELREKVISSPALSAENLRFSYSEKNILDNVSISIAKGSITGLIGHNGSGKTTLAKLLAGVYSPDRGDILIDDKKLPRDIKSRMKEIAYMHQSTSDAFFTDTVEDELAYTPNALELTPVVTLESLGLEHIAQDHPSFLSGGQKQKLAIGCAISANSEIVILDEPTTGFNQQERLELTQTLLDLQSRGKTIIVISHDWNFIARTTNNLVIMDHGKVAETGATKELMQNQELFESLGFNAPKFA